MINFKNEQDMKPKEIPSVILKVRDIINSVKNAGIDKDSSPHAILFIPLNMRLPTIMRAGAITGCNSAPLSVIPSPIVLMRG